MQSTNLNAVLAVLGLISLCYHCAISIDVDSCLLPITSRTVADSWQSSMKGTACFRTISAYRRDTAEFLHTGVGTGTIDAGYHWFAVKLTKTLLMTSVILKNGESRDDDGKPNSCISDVEVWTARSRHSFGSQGCRTRGMASAFERTKADWVKCGDTPGGRGIRSGQEVVVKCSNPLSPAQMVLMRKLDTSGRSCMGFVSLWIRIVDVNIEISPPGPVSALAEPNPGLRVTCHQRCGPELSDNLPLTLCLPDSSCVLGGRVNRPLLSARDSGRFECRFGELAVSYGELSVLHPPERLQVELLGSDEVLDHRLIQGFLFVTSESIPRETEHGCSAPEAGDVQVYRCAARTGTDCMETWSDASGQKKSHWIVSVALPTNLSIVRIVCGVSSAGSGWAKTLNYSFTLRQSRVPWIVKENGLAHPIEVSQPAPSESSLAYRSSRLKIVHVFSGGVVCLGLISVFIFAAMALKHCHYRLRPSVFPRLMGQSKAQKRLAARNTQSVTAATSPVSNRQLSFETHTYEDETSEQTIRVGDTRSYSSGAFETLLVVRCEPDYDQLLTITGTCGRASN